MKYYSTRRPIGIGVLTSGAMEKTIRIENYDTPVFIPEIDHTAWGYIETSDPLDVTDVKNSDLTDPDAYDVHALIIKVAQMLVDEEGMHKRDAYRMAREMDISELRLYLYGESAA